MDDKIERFLKISLVNREVNWYKTENEGMYTDSVYSLRECALKDFGDSPEAEATFKSWAGITILCPEIPDGQELALKGDISSMIS